jgi:hypothetical protein
MMPNPRLVKLSASHGLRHWGVKIGLGLGLGLLWGGAAIAQTPTETPPAVRPSGVLFQQLITLPSSYEIGNAYEGDRDDQWPVIDEIGFSLFDLTLPSIWWNRDQVYERWGGYRLLRGWVAFRSRSANTNILDVDVDGQYWNRLEYSQKYALLNQLGTTARSYGYQVRIYRGTTLVGIAACDFSSHPELSRPVLTEVPADQIGDLNCSAGIGPFVFLEPPSDTLFAPP